MSDLDRLAADLTKGALKTTLAVAAVVKKGAQNVKTGMVADAQSSGSYKHFHRSIGYDVDVSAGAIEAEIGPDKDKPQGALGNLLYFGSSKNAPVLDLEGPLRDEAANFEKYVIDAAEKSLGL